jgi:hypothetical protein
MEIRVRTTTANDPKLSHGHRRPAQQWNNDNQISWLGQN